MLKNFESHNIKNLNANVLYGIITCFLIFLATSFDSMTKLQFYLMLSIMGADVSLYGIDKSALPKLEETKIRNALDLLSSDSLSKIKSYSINTANVKRHFLSPGEDEIFEFIIGGGLRPKS